MMSNGKISGRRRQNGKMQKNMRYQKKAYILITIWLMEIQILKLVIV